jgi:2-methylcitrate dehydratase PrpD
MGVTETLARLAIETPWEDIPEAAKTSGKLRILDMAGIALAGSHEQSTLIALETARHMGGTGRTSVIGHKDRTSSPLAAYVNATAAHAQEYDDYTKGVTHASVVIVPGALALAEDRTLSGRELLAGFITGFEVESRVARGIRPALLDRGWHPNAILGSIGVAVAGARMGGFSVDQTRMAIGVAASEGSGLRKNVGSMGKAFHVGHGAKCGVFAALLAERGYQMDPDIIEPSESDVGGHEKFGLAVCFAGDDGYDLSKMTAELGTRWELAENTTIVCFHPGSTAPASTIDAVLDVMKEHGVSADDLERVHAEVTPQARAIACYDDVRDSYKARYSLKWSIAVTLIDGKNGLAQYDQSRVDKGDVQPLMKKVDVTVPDDFSHHHGQWGVDGVNWAEMRITFHLKDGRTINHARSYARGWSEEPATWDDIADKFRDCADGVIDSVQCEDAISMIQDLENLDDVSRLMGRLQPT